MLPRRSINVPRRSPSISPPKGEPEPKRRKKEILKKAVVRSDNPPELGRDDPKRWILFTMQNTAFKTLLQESTLENQNSFLDLFMTYFDMTGYMPKEIESRVSDPIILRVTNLSNHFEDGESYFSANSLPFKEPQKITTNKWRVILNETLAQFLILFPSVGDTVLIYGADINSMNNTIGINLNNNKQNIYVFIVSGNANNEMASKQASFFRKNYITNNTKLVSNDPEVYVKIIYSMSMIIRWCTPVTKSSHKLLRDDKLMVDTTLVNKEAGRIPIDDMENEEGDRILMEIEEHDRIPVNNMEIEEGDRLPVDDMQNEEGNRIPVDDMQNEEGNRVPVDNMENEEGNRVPVDNMENEEGNRIPFDNMENEQGNRIPVDNMENEESNRIHIDNMQNEEGNRIPIDNMQNEEGNRIPPTDIDEMTYSDWVTMKKFVPGDERPKVKKFKGTNYKYESLQDLDNALRQQSIAEIKRGSKASMILKEQRFTYGVVMDILPARVRVHNSYSVRIYDETKENVLLRICTSSMEKRVGPQIKIGQVIRVHRMSVQVEHDNINTITDNWEMVLSTTPHLNYTLFYFDAKNHIVYNTLAGNITLTTEDEKRVYDLLMLARRKENSTNHIVVSQQDGVQTNENNSGQIVGPVPSTSQNPSNPQRLDRGHWSPTFHRAAPKSPV